MTDSTKEPDEQRVVPPPVAAPPPVVTPPPPVTSPTAVMPQVPAVTPPVAPSTDEEPTADSVPGVGDTTDFTLGDITLSDSSSGGLRERFSSLATRLRTLGGAKKPPSSEGFTARTSRWRLRAWQWALIGVGALVLLFGIFVAVDAGLYYGKVHHGVSVAGQDLSRSTGDKATESLTGLVEEAQNKPITLRSDAHTWDVLPGDLGTAIDVPGAVAKAMALTREGGVFSDLGKKIALYFDKQDLPLEGTVDDAKMEALLTTISETLDVPAVNATLRVVDGQIEVVDGVEGKAVDQEALRTSLTELLFALHDTELPIPMVVASPDLSAVDVEPALAQANIMVSADLSLTYKDKTLVTLTPTQIVTYLDVSHEVGADAAKAVPILSAEKMADLLDAVEPQVGTAPINATYEMDLDAPEPYPLKLVAGVDGEGLDREGTAAALTQAAMSATDRSIEVVLKSVEPEFTAADVEAMGIKDLLGDYRTTPYVGSKNRQQNVRLATSLCSGVFLAPGEEFNTDQRLGKRDAAHGWETAPGITGPGKLEEVYGGGICQVSTTLFNAVLVSGLEITERHNHSIFINHYPNGRDATVTGGGKNMRFRNDTDHYVFIYGWSTGINTRFWIWGVDDGREVLPIKFSGFTMGEMYSTQTVINKSLAPGATEEIFEGQQARRCSMERTVVYADGTRKTEKFSSYYPKLDRVIETNPKPVTTTTKPPVVTTTSTTSTTVGP